METPEDETVVLKGQAAVNLWRQGRTAWNKWAAENPDAKVDFSGFDFSDYDVVSFDFFNFPEGKNSVSFQNAEFGDGKVDFSNATFGGDVDFSETTFGNGNISFFGANFGNGNINFSQATCGMGHFAIKECSFGNGKDKSEQKDAAKSDQKGAITFDHVDFGGRFSFQNCKETGNIQSLSFKGCAFQAGVTLAAELTCVPDLRGIIVTAHIDLEELQVNSKSRAIEDAPQYRRLKELAERNRHHEAALRFFADERRCMRWARGDKPWQTAWSYLASVLDVIYAGACDYGRSIAWPVGWLGGLISGSTAVLVNCFKIPLWPDALPMVLTSSIPFLPAGRVSATEHQWAGDVGHLLPYFELWFLGHQFFSFILLFLIGIGLRNRFRL
jgi:hypothetical protein